MKNKKIIISLSAVLAVIIALFAFFYFKTKPETTTDKKTISVTVVFADKSDKDYTIETKSKFLSDALNEIGLLDEKEYEKSDGLYTYIAGERADYTLDGSWWCITKDGEMTTVGMNELSIADGDSFEITNTPA